MRVDQPKSAEAARPSAEPSDLRDIQMMGVSDDDAANRPFSGEQDSHLASEIHGQSGEVPCQIEGNHLLYGNTTPKSSLKGSSLRGLEALHITADLLNATPPLSNIPRQV